VAVSQDEVRERARRVRAVVLDVDGVLTDAALWYGPRGEIIKGFSARDGFAIKAAQSAGISVAILSGRISPPLKARLRDLGIPRELVIQGSKYKGPDLERLAGQLGLEPGELAYMGDDLPDLPAFFLAGLAACPADAAREVHEHCHHVCRNGGGRGAVRELVELILVAQDLWDGVVAAWRDGRAAHQMDSRPSGERGE
jgi:3-deoxy-D-manno-octulosonate 8-phosphate phosphatase (KDO 8-P phosphatase)